MIDRQANLRAIAFAFVVSAAMLSNPFSVHAVPGGLGVHMSANEFATGNTHSGVGAVKATFASTPTWNNLFQVVSVTPGSTYTVSFWAKGTGKVVLRIDNGAFKSELARQSFIVTSSWQQYYFNVYVGSNSQLTYNFVDGGGVAGTVYIDDCFLGVRGGSNTLANPGFEENAAWSADPVFKIVANP